MARNIDTALILGGAGLVGIQVARQMAEQLSPKRIVIVSLWRDEVREAVKSLSRSYPDIRFPGYYGDVFVRGRLTPVGKPAKEISPAEFKSRPENRADLFGDTFRDFEAAYAGSALVRILLEEEPDVVVDSINTATAISYQDVFSTSRTLKARLEEWEGSGEPPAGFPGEVESLLISTSIPQLITHVRLLSRALEEAGVHMYLKIGTTGTGGMGLNIPYTHGEDKPSPTLMTKTSVAFAHSGLLWLMARSPSGAIIKELKPAAMIGYRDIAHSVVRGAQWVPMKKGGRTEYRKLPGRPYVIYRSKAIELGKKHDTTPDFDGYKPRQDSDGKDVLFTVPCVNTGENGLFTRGEFEAITHLDQMEMITPEEIAEVAVLEIRGSNTGHDVLSAVDSAILDPSYKGGIVRRVAIDELERLEEETGVPSVALGQLGPPQLSKYLYEAHLFRKVYGTLRAVVGEKGKKGPKPAEISERLLKYLNRKTEIRDTITSIGIPILHPDGKKVFRGPFVSIPPYRRGEEEIDLTSKTVDAWARKGWVDLRPSHMKWWVETFAAMLASTEAKSVKLSSERVDRRLYLHEGIRIGEVVAWIFNNLLEPPGHRIK